MQTVGARPTHLAFVEERLFDDGQAYFVAGCLRTGKQCDAFAFEDPILYDNPWDRAVRFLGWTEIHDDPKSEHFCNANHVLA